MSDQAGTRVLRATALLSGVSLAVAVLGFLKNIVAAYFFGTSGAMDVYFLALVIPEAAAFLAITGVFNFVPLVATARASGGDEEAARVGGKLVTFWLFLLVVALALCFAAAPLLSRVIAQGLPDAGRALHVAHVRTLTLMAMGIGGARVLVAVYTARKHFLVPSLSEISFQAGSIGYLLVFHAWGVSALAWSMVFGGSLQLAVVAVGLRLNRIPVPASFDPRHSAVQKMIRLTVPVYVGNVGVQVNQMVVVSFASTLVAGAYSALQYAGTVVEAVSTLLGSSLAKAAFPFLAQDVAEGRRERVVRGVERGLAAMVLVATPAGLGLLLLAEPAVTALFQRGSFDARSTQLTVVALRIYALGLFASVLTQLVASVYFAHGNTSTPMRVGFVRVAASILLCSILVKPLGHAGIAAASVLSEGLKLVLMLVGLRRHGLDEAVAGARRTAGRLLPAVALMGVVVFGTSWVLGASVRGLPRAHLLGLLVPAAVGALSYVGLVRFFAPEEFAYFRGTLLRLLPNRSQSPPASPE